MRLFIPLFFLLPRRFAHVCFDDSQNRPAAPRNSYPQSKSTYQPPPPSHSSYNRRHSQNYNNQIHHSPSTSFAPVQQSYPQPYQAPLPPQYGDGNGNGPPLPPDFIPPPENTQSHFPAAYQRDISLHSHRQSQALERRPSISNSNYNPNYDSNSRTASYPTFPDSVPNQPSSYAQAQSQSRPRADSRSHPHPAEQAHPSRSQQHDNEQRRPRSPAYSPPLEVTRVPSYAQQQQQKQQYDDDDMSRRGVPFTVTDPSLGRDGNTGSSAGGGFGKSRKSAGPGLGAGGAGWGHNFNDDEPSSSGRGGGGGRAHQAAAPAKAPETKGRNKPPPGFGGLNAIFNQAISSSVSTSNKPGTGKGKGATRRIQQEEEDGEQNGADDYQAREQKVKALPSFKKPSRGSLSPLFYLPLPFSRATPSSLTIGAGAVLIALPLTPSAQPRTTLPPPPQPTPSTPIPPPLTSPSLLPPANLSASPKTPRPPSGSSTAAVLKRKSPLSSSRRGRGSRRRRKLSRD